MFKISQIHIWNLPHCNGIRDGGFWRTLGSEGRLGPSESLLSSHHANNDLCPSTEQERGPLNLLVTFLWIVCFWFICTSGALGLCLIWGWSQSLWNCGDPMVPMIESGAPACTACMPAFWATLLVLKRRISATVLLPGFSVSRQRETNACCL